MFGLSLEKWGEVSRVSAGGTKAKQYPQHRSAMALWGGSLGCEWRAAVIQWSSENMVAVVAGWRGTDASKG